ncbi:MAG: hypothetical protein EP330_27350 [Deltaproteobacteria bacterium]|nr:MAG: hypothetical protein EP330_27350 [Deltaproteobacteria bacterium]
MPYPTRSTYHLKGIQPDFWPNKQELSGNQAGGVAMNLVWATWEPTVTTAPCANGQEAYDGHCFTVHAATDDAIREWTDLGVVVTAVVYGVPEWARMQPCVPVTSGFEIFCAPDEPADYARFAGFLADRYDGNHGHGRIADFVVHNEVNSNDWFDVACGQGTACDANAWLGEITANYNAAYDAVIAEQPQAKVFVSLTHHFGDTYDQPSASNPLLSAETVLTAVADAAGSRDWRVAYHPYPPDLTVPTFSAEDWPKVTYGNIGTLAGWLYQNYPNSVAAREIHLTESGVNSIAPNATQAAQADGVCDSLRNVVATPGIESYIYHRMQDHPVEVAQGIGLGLRDDNGNAKASWAVWALANRFDLQPPQLDCGFEHLPFTRLARSYDSTRGHWASTRIAPDGFSEETAWLLYREPQANTRLLFECQVGQHNLVTADPGCEGQHPLGPLGYASTSDTADTVPLYRCRTSGGDHFVSGDAACEGQIVEQLLGYVWVP